MNTNTKVNLSRAVVFALALMASAASNAWWAGGGGWHGGGWHGGGWGGGWHGGGWGGSSVVIGVPIGGYANTYYAPSCYRVCNDYGHCWRRCN